MEITMLWVICVPEPIGCVKLCDVLFTLGVDKNGVLFQIIGI